jgi:hypothetical protein
MFNRKVLEGERLSVPLQAPGDLLVFDGIALDELTSLVEASAFAGRIR